MACLCGGGTTTQNQSGTSNTTGNSNGTTNSTSTPNLPQWLIDRIMQTNGSVNGTGANAAQGTASDYLLKNLTNNTGINTASATAGGTTENALRGLDAAGNRIGNMGDVTDRSLEYLANQQNNGSFTLGKYFPDAPTSGDTNSVMAARGADYAGGYATPLQADYVNASLADYDNNAAQQFNGFRAANAGAWGNKRTGVGEAVFKAASDRGRSTLDSGLRLNAFNTAAGYGMSDADRALSASTSNAGNKLSNNQFNASLADSRQKFDINQAETGEQRRLGVANQILSGAATGANIAGQGAAVAGQGAAIGTQNLNNALNVNGANVGNANAVLGANGMTFDQLMKLIQAGGIQVGQTNNGSFNSNNNSNTVSTGTGATTKPGDPLGTIAKLGMAFL